MVNTLMLVYSGTASPLKTRDQRNHELFTEFMVLEISLTMIFFTDLVEDTILQYNIGWMMLAMNYLLMLMNAYWSLSAINSEFLVTSRIKLWFRKLKFLLKHRRCPSKKTVEKIDAAKIEISTAEPLRRVNSDNIQKKDKSDLKLKKKRKVKIPNYKKIPPAFVPQIMTTNQNGQLNTFEYKTPHFMEKYNTENIVKMLNHKATELQKELEQQK